MTELQIGKYEFYPNEDELKRLALIDELFEKNKANLDDKSIEQLLKELSAKKLRGKRRIERILGI
jgi:hypothetical protein